MATLRELKGRIGSVASSEKITGAMKMISSAKMHKAEQSLQKLLPFRRQLESVIANLLSADVPFSSPLMEVRPEIRKMAVVVFGSDDGLCGAYNTNVYKELASRVNKILAQPGAPTIEIIPVGSKMEKAAARLYGTPGVEIKPVEGVNSKTGVSGVSNFVSTLRDKFIGGEYDRVDVMYMHFKSVSRQTLTFEQLLPLEQSIFDGSASGGQPAQANRPYLFEPDAQTIFVSILPMFLISYMQEVFTENRASEQAARVMAMQSANDNAKKLLEQLRLEYNKLRQQSITTELLDILGGQVR